MANPVVSIRNTGRDSASLSDVRALSDNVCTSWTSVTTGTIAVTDDTNTDVSFTQPADTIIRNLIAIPAGNIVTGGSSGNDVDFSLGTSSGGLLMHHYTLFKTLMVMQLMHLLALALLLVL